MHIRYYTSEDKKQVILLWKKVFFDAPPWAEPSILLKKKLEVDNLVFVAEDNGKVIGSSMAGYDGHSGWIYSVFFLPCLRSINSLMFFIGPGRYRAFIAIRSSMEVGFNFFRNSRIPDDSN